MREWRRSEAAHVAVMIASGMLVAFALVAWRAIGITWAVVLLAAAFLLQFVTDEDEEPGDEAYRRRGWGENGERWSMTDAEFDALVGEVESAAATTDLEGAAIGEAEEREFAAIVRDAIEELPGFVKAELARNVAVIIAEDGALPERYGHSGAGGLFGLYVGWTASAPSEGARIVLFRDTLTRSFEDPDELREQVVITLRHEIAHHFGADERRVEELGL